jgi:hypothetical protein
MALQVSECCEFPQISRSILYEIITVTLGYLEFCAKMSFENAHRCAHSAGNIFGVCRLFRGRPQDGDEFLNHIVTGDETFAFLAMLYTPM